jgi:hypothetical protein
MSNEKSVLKEVTVDGTTLRMNPFDLFAELFNHILLIIGAT